MGVLGGVLGVLLASEKRLGLQQHKMKCQSGLCSLTRMSPGICIPSGRSNFVVVWGCGSSGVWLLLFLLSLGTY